MATLNELVTGLSFKIDSQSFQNLAKITVGLDALVNGFEAVGKAAGFLGGGKGLSQLITSTAEEGHDLWNIADNLGMSAKGVQKWIYAMKQSGGTAEDMIALLKKMKEYGIDTDEELLKFADDMASADWQERYPWVQTLGEKSINLLKQGAERIKADMSDIDPFVLSDEQVEKAKEMDKSLTRISETLKGSLKQSIVEHFMPAAKQMSDWLADFMKDEENRELVFNGLTASITALGAAGTIKVLKGVASAIKDIVAAFELLKPLASFLVTPTGGLILGLISAGVSYKLIQSILEKQKKVKDMTNEEYEKHLENEIEEQKKSENEEIAKWAKDIAKEKNIPIEEAMKEAEEKYYGAALFSSKDLEKELKDVRKNAEHVTPLDVTYEGGETDKQRVARQYLERYASEQVSQDNSTTEYNTFYVTVQGDSSKGAVEMSASGIKAALEKKYPNKKTGTVNAHAPIE